ncbi:MAG TPA: cytochrome c biogenesis protein [Bryobacteraceae bacterium]|nr:cytochrome c biogenesis protein [Bryobacteraceae bacterium]
MRDKIIIALVVFAVALLGWSLYRIFMVVPDEANQGAIFRIIYIHLPTIFTGFLGFMVALVSSILYLTKGDMKYDSLAAGVTEVALVFAGIVLVTGSIWARIIWGVWWAWEPRLTSMLICWLTYAGYLMLRRAIDEPAQRARLSAVVSIFGFVEVIIVYKAIDWFRTLHPQPVLSVRGGGGMAPGMEAPIYWNWLAFVCLATAMVMIRMKQDEMSREIDSLRREAHLY